MSSPEFLDRIISEMKTQYILKNEKSGTFYYSDKKMTKQHREDGPAGEYSDGTKSWYLNGQLHREDGPAVEWANGSKSWYLNGKLHREDGPAVEWASGTKYWYLNGQPLSKEEWEKRVTKKTINVNGKDFTVEELNALIASVK